MGVGADALALAGVDYLVVGPKVLETLAETPTLEGYNDGLTTLPIDDDIYEPRLSHDNAKEVIFSTIPSTRVLMMQRIAVASCTNEG